MIRFNLFPNPALPLTLQPIAGEGSTSRAAVSLPWSPFQRRSEAQSLAGPDIRHYFDQIVHDLDREESILLESLSREPPAKEPAAKEDDPLSFLDGDFRDNATSRLEDIADLRIMAAFVRGLHEGASPAYRRLMTYFRDYRKAEFRPPVSDEIRKALIQRLPAMAYFPNLASAPDGIALIYNLQNLRTEILGWDFTSAAVSQAIVSLTKDIELLQKEIRKARDLRGGGVVELKRKYPSRYLLNDNSLNVIPEQTLFNDCRQGQRLRELLWLLLPLMPNVNHFPPVR